MNSTKYQVSVNYAGDEKKVAAKGFAGWELWCAAIDFAVDANGTVKYSANYTKSTVYMNSSMSASGVFTAGRIDMVCLVHVYAGCTNNTVSTKGGPALGFSYTIPPGNLALPVYQSPQQVAAALNTLNSSTGSSSDKLSTIANLASNIANMAANNVSSVDTSTSSSVLQAMNSIVASQNPAAVASNAAQSLTIVANLIAASTGSSGQGVSAVSQQAGNVLSVVLASVANQSAPMDPAFGNIAASSVAAILQVPGTDANVAYQSLNSLSAIAANQLVDIAMPVSYTDPTGLVSVSAVRSAPGNLAASTTGNNTFESSGAFNSYLSGISTTYVTSKSIAIAINPFASLKADDGNSTRSGIFQYSLFDDQGSELSVSNLASNFSMGFFTAGMQTPAFAGAQVVPICQYWNIAASTWSSEGCYYDTDRSSSGTGFCKCNHLTAFSISFASVVPNTLDPVSDALNAEHAGLIYLLGASMTVIWIFMVTLRWYRNRALSFMRSGVGSDDFAAYDIIIKTDDSPHSCVTARTYVTLHGEDSSTERILFSQGLAAGSTVKKTIIAINIGAVVSIDLAHDETGAMLNWRPVEVVASNITSGAIAKFSPSGIVTGRALTCKAISVLQSDSSFYRRLRSHFVINLQDRHIWLSTVTAPTTSRFSHTERTAICFLLLFGNMGLGFWFHKQRSLTGDFISVVLVSIITSGMMLALTLPLMWVLRKAEVGHHIPEVQTAMETGSSLKSKSRKSCIAFVWRQVAWLIILFATLGGAVLCVLSALQLDANNVSALAAALQSCAISLVESWLISSPLVVTGRSIYNAYKQPEVAISRIGASTAKLGGTDSRGDLMPQVQASAQVATWEPEPESIYPTGTTQAEPPMTSNGLSSAIVPPSQRRSNQMRSNRSDIMGV